jgi:phytoene/squalene synthetase
VEHCQDVREDFERGRIYLPAADMARSGCAVSHLGASRASGALVETVRLQVGRARGLLRSADLLLVRLRGVAVPLVAGYAAGGLATCDALERHGFDVLARDVRPARRDVLRHGVRLVARAWLARVGIARARSRR